MTRDLRGVPFLLGAVSFAAVGGLFVAVSSVFVRSQLEEVHLVHLHRGHVPLPG